MTAEELEGLMRRRPFTPFRIHLSDGSKHDIRHPEMAILTQRSLEFGVPRRRGSLIASRTIWCALLHIVKAQELAETRQAKI